MKERMPGKRGVLQFPALAATVGLCNSREEKAASMPVTRDEELEVTGIDRRAYAAALGYALDRKESWRGSSVMRSPAGDKVICRPLIRGRDEQMFMQGRMPARENCPVRAEIADICATCGARRGHLHLPNRAIALRRRLSTGGAKQSKRWREGRSSPCPVLLDDKVCYRPLSGGQGGRVAMTNELVKTGSGQLALADLPLSPSAVAVLGQTANAGFAADEFFKASINNPHTRRAYGRVIGRFLGWCDERGLALHNITPGLAGEYMASIEGSAPTKNQALAALRHFFDALVQRHAVALNSFASVRGVKHSVVEGKTAEISIEQARRLLRSVDTSDVVGLRDRAVLGVLAYTGARIGAVARLRLSDYRNTGEQRSLRFREKGGKEREIPVRHDLEGWLREYIAAAGIEGDGKAAPLFRPAVGKQKLLTTDAYPAHSMRRMLKRRLVDAGLPELFSPHSFRVAVVTDLLKQDVPLEDVQYLAGHSNPKTTQIYDRRRRRVTRNIVERISI
jgi:integrase/recombinase XerD